MKYASVTVSMFRECLSLLLREYELVLRLDRPLGLGGISRDARPLVAHGQELGDRL
jgi:hypothetical protein